ncbi:hypothetical protein SEA_PCORAL7_21 [Gordonia phage PCoral7]|uniref:Uncharacterized protein n=1 Tax=Gordonia phage Toast TaxID=2599852 RepID=A0A5J6TGX3_9CAUD|nr:hypothetical protein JZX81_gp21 [Gordonia phage Toast]QFG08082.1 hypothetical protein PBI_TOAST_21 [Gordonia phage Toast]UVF60529.1 hypothetical protein SEA_PCORAL7_21 [Gordonia phage PCoral7]
MSLVREGSCGEPGPFAAHCTEDPMHRHSCYDAGADVSFNHRQDFRHDCDDPACDRQHFTNEGD